MGKEKKTKREKRQKKPRITNKERFAEFLALPRTKQVLAIVYLVLRLAVVVVLIAQIFNKNWANVFTCVLTLILFMIPSFIERRIKIDVPDALEIIELVFIFSAEILGEIREYYVAFPLWDVMLHTLNGFLMGAIGLSLINILNRSDRVALSLSPLFVALVAFCFSMTIGVLWEFLEFSADRLLGTDMQKDVFVEEVNTVLLHPDGRNIPVHIEVESVVINGEEWPGYVDIGLFDTIKDMFVNFIGAVVFSVFGFFYSRRTISRKVVDSLMLTPMKKEGSPPDELPPFDSPPDGEQKE